MADYTPFPLSPWYERPDVATPGRSHKLMSASPNGNGGVSSEMLSVEQVLSLLNANDVKSFADPRTGRLAKGIDYTATVDDNRKIIAFTAAGKTLTLPRAAFALAAADGFMIVVSAEVGAVTIVRSGTDTIIGGTSITLNQGEVAQLFLDGAGAGWRAAVVSAYASNAKLDAVNVFSKRQHLAKGSNIVSASTLVLPDNGNFFDVTGTAIISAVSTVTQAGTRVLLRALGSWTLQHNAESLILPRAANLTVADGDVLELTSLGAGNYVLSSVCRADGKALATSQIFVSTQQAYTNNGVVTVAHGLGAKPSRVRARLVCLTAEGGYVVGDEIHLSSHYAFTSQSLAVTVAANSTSITFTVLFQINVAPKSGTGGSAVTLTPANWRVVLEAEL